MAPARVRTSGSVTDAIYGLILATSVIAVSREYDSSDAGLLGVTVLVTGVVFWLAHVYARVLAGSISHHRMLNRSEVREALRPDWPLVEVTVHAGLGEVGLVAAPHRGDEPSYRLGATCLGRFASFARAQS